MTITADQFLSLSVAIIVGLVIAWIALFYSLRSQPKILLALFADGLFLRMLTVVFIICAATGLAVADHLSAEVSAILAGIAGYVLGSGRPDRNRSENPNEKREESTNPEPKE